VAGCQVLGSSRIFFDAQILHIFYCRSASPHAASYSVSQVARCKRKLVIKQPWQNTEHIYIRLFPNEQPKHMATVNLNQCMHYVRSGNGLSIQQCSQLSNKKAACLPVSANVRMHILQVPRAKSSPKPL
jgi:hypothetical protein